MDNQALVDYLARKQQPTIKKKYRKYLTYEGVQDCYAYILKSGVVKTSVISKDGREFNIRYIKDLEIVSLIKDEYSHFIDAPYNIRVESQEAEFYRINRVQLWQDINQDPKLQHYVKEFYRQRLFYIMKKMQQMLMNGKLGAVCTQIYELSQQFGTPHPQGILIDLEITNEDIAHFCGISAASSVSRMLQQLKKQKIITIIDHHLIITDLELLKENILL